MYYQRNANKYNNTRKVYNGRSYMSKLEAQWAQNLDLMLKAKEIKEITPQFRLRLEVNGKHITDYLVDFLVINKDDERELWEIKGMETSTWLFKWRLAQALFGKDYKFVLIK